MRQLGMFAKYWQPGAVKTRLAESIGQAEASDLYRTFLSTLLGRFRATADRRLLVYTPASHRPAFQALAGEGWDFQPQSAGDLGRRMRRYFAKALDEGLDRVVLIGSDSPNLPAEFVDRAFLLLESHNVVLGPTVDGGYYLVGIRWKVPDIFDRIDWGSDDVWQQTVTRLERQLSSFARLPSWYDIDVWEDVRRLASDLSGRQSAQDDLADLRVAVGALVSDIGHE